MHDHQLVRCPIKRGDVLLVSTSASSLTDTEGPPLTGCWISEVAVPYVTLLEAGYDVTIASPRGGVVPVDEQSLKATDGEEGEAVQRMVKIFLKDDAARQSMLHSVPLSHVHNVDLYRAIWLAGGHGASVDFPSCAKLQSIVREALTSRMASGGGILVAAVCHGPAAFADEETAKMLVGRRVTAFSDAEERAVQRDGDVPFLLESRLKELGLNVTTVSPPSTPHVEVDGNLLTGQNPASSLKLAEVLVAALGEPPGQATGTPRLESPVPTHPGSMLAADAAAATGVSVVPPRPSSQQQATPGAQAASQAASQPASHPIDGGVQEPSAADNLGANANPNPGTNAGNDAPASA